MHEEQKLVKKYLEKVFPDQDTQTEVVLGEYPEDKSDPMYNPAKYRADAIVFGDGKIFIVEGKLEPDPSAIGQLLFYRKLFLETPRFRHLNGFDVYLYFVTTSFDGAIAEVCEEAGVTYEVFNPQ